MSSEQPEQPNSSLKEIFANNRGLAIVAGLLVVGFAAMFIMVLVLLLRDGGTDDVTPTPFADTTGTAVDVPLVVGISDTDRISVTLDLPVSLGVAGSSFAVQPQTVAADRIWSPRFENTETAVWVYGTIINYVIGVPESDSNRAALEQLAPGDLMQLTTKSGIVHRFTFSSREQILVGNPDVYSQHAPGLTLILVGTEGNERLVVNGRYLVDEAGNSGGSGGSAVELGEIAQLDDVQLTVTGAAYVLDRPKPSRALLFIWLITRCKISVSPPWIRLDCNLLCWMNWVTNMRLARWPVSWVIIRRWAAFSMPAKLYWQRPVIRFRWD